MREPKLVSTWKIVTLSVVTLSLYILRWYYRVNRELRDLGERRGDELRQIRPVVALLAITVGGWVVVPPFVSYVRFVGRLQRGERLATGRAGAAAAVLAPLLVGLIVAIAGSFATGLGALLATLVVSATLNTLGIALAQRRLNALWIADAPSEPVAVGMSME